MAPDTMRIGKRYCIINYGEKVNFTVQSAAGTNDFMVKDLLTLEVYRFSSLLSYGRGEDFELFEI